MINIVASGIYFDEFDLPVHAPNGNSDGGDTMQRLGFMHIAFIVRNMLGISNAEYMFSDVKDYASALQKLETQTDGIYVRHPSWPWNQPWGAAWGVTRDQVTPNLVAMGLYKLRSRIVRMVDAHEKRFMFRYQSGDVPNPEHRNHFRRALDLDWSYSWGDFFLYANSVLVCMKAKNDMNDVDDLNHIASLIQSILVRPTKWSKKALRYYLTNRPSNYGVAQLGEKDPVMGAIAWYFCPRQVFPDGRIVETGAPIGFVELYRPVIRWMRSCL